jgi:hypothetical protein
VNQLERRVRAAINPVSTAVTRWWCHSSVRLLLLTGRWPAAGRRRLLRHSVTPDVIVRSVPPRGGQARGGPQSAEAMRARAAAIDALLSRDREDG